VKGKLLPLRRVAGDAAEMSDDALLAASAVGESAALGALFDRYHARIHRFLGRLSGTDRRDLDDLVQATFLEVRRSAARFGGRASVKTWIFGIAVNVVRHHVRGEMRRRAMNQRFAELPAGLAAAPDTDAEQRQLLARVAAALAELPHDLKVALVMCDLEDIPGAEAARVLGVREGTLWRRLHEARKRLRAAVKR